VLEQELDAQVTHGRTKLRLLVGEPVCRDEEDVPFVREERQQRVTLVTDGPDDRGHDRSWRSGSAAATDLTAQEYAISLAVIGSRQRHREQKSFKARERGSSGTGRAFVAQLRLLDFGVAQLDALCCPSTVSADVGRIPQSRRTTAMTVLG
jgi:hypothetical protein